MKIKQILLIFVLLSSTCVLASMDVSEQVHAFRQQWAVVKYATEKQEQEQAFKTLAENIHQYNNANPDKPEAMIWEAIILSTLAGSEGGFSALKSVKQAKALLERAIKLNPEALDSGAYTSLGALYYQVPGWPISFGDDDLARKNLETAIEQNPNSIDANFFYAEFLKSQGEREKAVKYYQKALNAPARNNRPLADKGRREEIKQALSELD